MDHIEKRIRDAAGDLAAAITDAREAGYRVDAAFTVAALDAIAISETGSHASRAAAAIEASEDAAQ